MPEKKLTDRIIAFTVLTGAVLAMVQFFFNRSIWLDEAYLALNIIRKTHVELLKPLEYIQVGPVLFLQIEKLFSLLIPNSELGLRLFPLLCYLGSLFFFQKIVRKIFQNPYAILFSVSLFVFNITLLYFSNEVKQYMTDVMVLTAVYFVLLTKTDNYSHYYFRIGLVGTLSIFFSNISPIVLSTTFVYLLFDTYHTKKNSFASLITIGVVWAGTFVLYYFTFLNNHPSRAAQIWEWEQYHAFLPFNPFDFEFFEFLMKKGNMIFFSLFHFGLKGGFVLILLMLTGLFDIIRKRKYHIVLICISPLLMHLFLSSFKFYPFDLRLLLYTVPCIIILCACGFQFFFEMLFRVIKQEKLKRVFLSLPILGLWYLIPLLPLKHVEIKDSIRHIEKNILPGDHVFVNGYSGIPFWYYKEISYIAMDTSQIIFGHKTPIAFDEEEFKVDTLGYSEELNALKGRIWFLFTRIGDESVKIDFLKRHFSAKGMPKIEEYITTESDVYLYDLGE